MHTKEPTLHRYLEHPNFLRIEVYLLNIPSALLAIADDVIE
jgi:hypothetical protein